VSASLSIRKGRIIIATTRKMSARLNMIKIDLNFNPKSPIMKTSIHNIDEIKGLSNKMEGLF